MNLIRACRAFGAAFALVLLGVVAHAVLPTPQVQGPFLGDQFTNIFSLQQATSLQNQWGFQSAQTANNTTQATCTVITQPIVQFTTVASSGAACLPPATAGRMVFIANEGAQTLQLFGSNNPVVSGTQDTINTTAGSSAFAHPATGKLTFCFGEAAGAWRCSATDL